MKNIDLSKNGGEPEPGRGPDNRLLSSEEAARYCGVSKKFISKHTAAGRFPGVVRVGRLLHYDRHIIDRRIAAGRLLLEKQEAI
jgi:predicted DNA-binding transcriptional regulator AlpA